MDTFIEQIVQKRKDSKEWAIIVGVVLAALVVQEVQAVAQEILNLRSSSKRKCSTSDESMRML